LNANDREELIGQLARFAKSAGVQALLAERLNDANASPSVKRLVLQAMSRSGLKEAPDVWAIALTQALTGRDAEVAREAVAAVRALPFPKARAASVASALRKIAMDSTAPAGARLGALASVPGGLSAIEPPLFAYLLARLTLEEPVATRGLAAEVLTRATLTSEQFIALADAMKSLGPMEVDRLLSVFEKTTDEKVGLHLLAALKESSARAGIRANAVKTRLAKYDARVREEAEGLYAILNVDAGKQRAKLEELLAGVSGGDIRRGQAVFNSTKAPISHGSAAFGLSAICWNRSFFPASASSVATNRSSSTPRMARPSVALSARMQPMKWCWHSTPTRRRIFLVRRSRTCSRARSRSCLPVSISSSRRASWRIWSPS